MANIFPSAGNVGIGTTSPQAPLHIQTGSALLALFQSYPPNTANAYIQIESSNANNYSWQISNQDASGGNTANGLAFLEKTGAGSPVARVYFQQGGNVGVGIMNNGARFAVAGATPTNLVQLQGQAIVPAGYSALALGYGDAYDSVNIMDAGYIQAEHEGVAFQPLLLNPMGGAVGLGLLTPQYYGNQGVTVYQPPDQGASFSRFRVQQYLVATGNTENVMASFVQNTVANSPADSSAASFYIMVSGGVAGGNGTAGVRALECQASRALPATSNITRALEVGLHSQIAGNQNNVNIGLYVNSAHAGWLASGVRNDTGIYITGQDGWYNAVVYTDETDTVIRFKVGQHGEIYASAGNFQVDPSGNVKANGTLAAANAVSGVALFNVDSSGNVSATSFNTTSSRTLKSDISTLTADRAAELLDHLEPVTFRYKHMPDRQQLGFILEDTPAELAPTGRGVSVMDLIAVLTRVAKEQRRELEMRRKEQSELRQRLEELKRIRRDTGPESAPPR